MFDRDLLILIVQIIAALGVVISVVYLGLQIRQQNIITKAQFGHSLTQRLYDRYFQTSKDPEYAKFMSKDWSKLLDDPVDGWRVSMAILTYLVDIFDVYDKVETGLVDRSHLDTRMNTLKFGVMKTPVAKGTWASWKTTRDKKFVEWFEREIYGDEGLNIDDFKSEISRKELNTYRD